MSEQAVDRGGMPILQHGDREAWEVALDRLELDLVRMERALGVGEFVDDGTSWEVPGKYGPMPGELRERAEELVARQRSVIETLRERMATTLRQRAVVETIARAAETPEPRAAYIDMTA